MAVQRLPPTSQISYLPSEGLTSILDQLFEPCVPLHTLSVNLLRDTTFATYGDLVAAVGDQLSGLARSTSTSDTAWLESILSAHPRLGEKKIHSTQSSAEQAQLQGDEAENEKLAGLNTEYEQTFPGLRYVVFVNGRDRPTIMDDMRARIQRQDITAERADAIKVGPY